MKKDYPKEYYQKTSHEQIIFKDGMIVTAEHLQAAVQYPISVFQTLIRAFFGCGIVCGLKVEWVPGEKTREYDDEKKNVWSIKVNPGVALDCQGYPLELCQPVQIDLTPNPCSCDAPPSCVCIAIRRYIEEGSQPKSSCNGSETQQSQDCSRKREQVMIKVFEIDKEKGLKLPENTCMRSVDTAKETDQPSIDDPNYEEECETKLNALCDCLKACPDHHCCGEGWVLLACIKLGECGIECIDNRRRKYVKPIDCLCPVEEKECLYEQAEVDMTKEQPAEKATYQASIEQPADKPKSGRSRQNK